MTAAAKCKEVNRLDKETAEFKKQEQILLGEGEAERKCLVLNANGALEGICKRAVGIAYENLSKYQGSLVQDLGLDMTMPIGRQTSNGGSGANW